MHAHNLDIPLLSSCASLEYVCNYLRCYKVRGRSIITRCIYCGDSVKHPVNHGHFYIFVDFPFATCFRCGTQVVLSRWLQDLRAYLPEQYMQYVDDVEKFLLENFQLGSARALKSYAKTKTHKTIRKPTNYSAKTSFFLAQLGINKSEYSDYRIYEEQEEELLLYGIYYRAVARANSIDHKLQLEQDPIDMFTYPNLHPNDTVHFTEGIWDAIALTAKHNVRTIAVGGLAYFPAKILSFIETNYIPHNIIVYYDLDVPQNIVKMHTRRYKYICKMYDVVIKLRIIKHFKDVTRAIRYNALFFEEKEIR